MSEKTTKIITTVFSILLLLVILGATAVLFCCNLFTVHLPDAKFDSRFLTGKYTKSLNIFQIDYNIVSLLKQIPNFTYAGFVIDYQAYDAEIKEYKGEIVNYREYYNNATAENDKNRYQNKIDDLSAKVDFIKEKQTLLVNGMSNEDMALLSELLADADFVNLLGMYYIMGSGSALFLGDTLTGINNNTNREWGSFFLGMVFAPICVILFACFVLMIVILAIVFAIQAISDTVKCLRRIGSADHSLVKSMQNKLLYYSLSISMIFILPLKLCMGTTFAIGKAYLWMFILYLVSRAVITVYNMLTSDEKHAILFVKQTLALISAVVLVIAAFAVLNSGFISHVLADADAFGNAYSSNYVITGGNTSLVEKETAAVVTKADAIVTILFLILGIFVLYLAFVAIEKLAMQKYKSTQGIMSYREKYILTAIALVLSVVLSTFGVSGIEEQTFAFKDGNYAFITNEYEVKDSDDYQNYTSLLKDRDFWVELIESLEKALENPVEGETLSVEAAKEYAEKKLDQIDYRIASLEKATSFFTLLTVCLAVSFVSDLLYRIVPAILAKKLDGQAE